ncbi:GUN4 domain-containing protein [Aphanizomenon flos-aquae]|uniref:GUN4 domain-containing protein n=1 Tax=Aphanizomenon flos-aquae TaxID=1176 RepID=UPI00068D8A7D|nr:GUN4 domain-containing protein [Aphanizomenon flos-aquae]
MNMNLSNPILKNNSAIFSVTASVFVFFVGSTPAQAGKNEDIAQQTTVQINSEGNNSPGGSGVIINKKGKIYTVLTANHVVCDAIKGRTKVTCTTDVTYTIRTYTGKDYPIKDRQVLQKNQNDPDLAVVTFEAQENYPVATLGNSQEVEREADIKVTGFPTIFGKGGTEREYSVTRGKVTTLLRKEKNGYTLVYDATTKTGNSGGPVFDISGRVIGIHGQGDYGGEDGSDPSELQTTRIQKPVIPVKKLVPGKKETGRSPEGKTGFNGAIPINTYFALIGEKPPTPNPSRGVIPPKTEQEPIATRGNTGNFPSSMDKLSQLLSQGDWKGADEETKSLMLEISQASGSLNDKAISRLSCGNLSAINQIWQTKSQGRFGFSVQAQKWKSLFGNKFEPTNEHFEDFATDLGWRYRGRYLSNNQLNYSLDAPKGYLPRAFLDGPVWGNFIAYFDGCKIK